MCVLKALTTPTLSGKKDNYNAFDVYRIFMISSLSIRLNISYLFEAHN